MVQVLFGAKVKLSIISVMSSPSAPLVPKTQSRKGVRPVRMLAWVDSSRSGVSQGRPSDCVQIQWGRA
jgi:hypothetical protein